MKYLIFLAAMSLFPPLACGCATFKQAGQVTVAMSSDSSMDMYTCGYLTDFDKYSKSLTCAPFEVFMPRYLPGVCKQLEALPTTPETAEPERKL